MTELTRVDIAHECPQSEKLVTVIEDYRAENERLRRAIENRGTETEALKSRIESLVEQLRRAEA